MPTQQVHRLSILIDGVSVPFFKYWEAKDGTLGCELVPGGSKWVDYHGKPTGWTIGPKQWSIHPSDHLETHCDVTFKDFSSPSQRSKFLSSELKGDISLHLFSYRFPAKGVGEDFLSKKRATPILTFHPTRSMLFMALGVRRIGSTEELYGAERFQSFRVPTSRFELLFYWRFWPIVSIESSRFLMTMANFLGGDIGNYDQNGNAIGFVAKSALENSLTLAEASLVDQAVDEISSYFQDSNLYSNLYRRFLGILGPDAPELNPVARLHALHLLDEIEKLALRKGL